MARRLAMFGVWMRDLATDPSPLANRVAGLIPHAAACGVEPALEPLHPVCAAGDDGPCEVEVFPAANWWRRAPDAVPYTVVARFRDLCRAAGAAAAGIAGACLGGADGR